MKFAIHQDSRTGGRQLNQDRLACCYSRDALLLVVADGMGGHLHGEVAAQIAVNHLTEAFRREALPRLPDPYLFLSWGLESAHRAIVDHAKVQGWAEAPRTTCVACIVQDNVACWAHVGDSRLYVIRDGRVLARTQDHSQVQLMIEQGLLDPAAAASHPARNLVYACLGGEVPPAVEFSRKTTLNAGDVIALCTDGVWGPLDDRLPTLLAVPNVARTVPHALDAALAQGGAGADNASLILVHWQESYDDEAPGGVETSTMALDTHTTMLMDFAAPAVRETSLSAEDIDRAIEEIRHTIQRHTR